MMMQPKVTEEQPINTPRKDYNQKNQPQSVQSPFNYYMLSWIYFIVAFGVYLSVWAIDKYAVKYLQTTFYYKNDFTIPNSVAISSQLYTSGELESGVSIAMPLVYTWMLWKLALVVYGYQLAEGQKHLGVRFISFSVFVAILLTADIILTYFLPAIYNQWLFFGIYAVLVTILALLNRYSQHSIMSILYDSVLVMVVIACIYATYTVVLPQLLKLYTNSLSFYGSIFVHIYLMPVWDCILYGSLVGLGRLVSEKSRNFYFSLHYLLMGYSVGCTLLVRYTEVQFYYLLVYFLLKNIFVNWVIRKEQDFVGNPACLPGWILVYYISYLLNFVPLNGLIKICFSRGFFTQMWSSTTPLLYPLPNPIYPYSVYSQSQINYKFEGNIFWLGGLLIWIVMTFSQKYPLMRIEWKQIFYYLWSIYLFYTGISAGLQIWYLAIASL